MSNKQTEQSEATGRPVPVINAEVEAMLNARTFAVVGASTNREKYGNIAYRSLKSHGKTVYPVNPRASEIEGDPCYPSITQLPEVPHVVVSVVPSKLTEALVDEAAHVGVTHIWMQPGAESAEAIRKAHNAGIHVVAQGPCIMVGLRTHAVRSKG
jgi:hypothetical protein